MKWLLPILLFPAVSSATTYSYSVLDDASGYNIHGDRTYSEQFTNADIPGMTITCDNGQCFYDIAGTADQASFHTIGRVDGPYNTNTGLFEIGGGGFVDATWEGVNYTSDSGKLLIDNYLGELYIQGYFHEVVPEGLLELCVLQRVHFDGPKSLIASNPEPASLLLAMLGIPFVRRARCADRI